MREVMLEQIEREERLLVATHAHEKMMLDQKFDFERKMIADAAVYAEGLKSIEIENKIKLTTARIEAKGKYKQEIARLRIIQEALKAGISKEDIRDIVLG